MELNKSKSDLKDIFNNENIKLIKEKIINGNGFKTKSNFVDRGMRSQELNAIIKKAQVPFEYDTSQPSQAPRGSRPRFHR